MEGARVLVDKLVAPKFDMDLEMKYGADGNPMRMQAIEQVASPSTATPSRASCCGSATSTTTRATCGTGGRVPYPRSG